MTEHYILNSQKIDKRDFFVYQESKVILISSDGRPANEIQKIADACLNSDAVGLPLITSICENTFSQLEDFLLHFAIVVMCISNDQMEITQTGKIGYELSAKGVRKHIFQKSNLGARQVVSHHSTEGLTQTIELFTEQYRSHLILER